MSRAAEAAAAVHRALLDCAGPGAAEHLAMAQARLAWAETVEELGLERGPLHSRLVTVLAGVARVEASEAALAQELTLRGDDLVRAVNARMRDRPGATIVLHRMAVSVGRGSG